MHFLDLTLPTVAENLALDEALLLEADAGRGQECLRLWESPVYAVVLGASGMVQNEVALAGCNRDDVPLFRRASGGGTVLMGPGCLCYSLILSLDERPELRQVPSSYCYIMPKQSRALQPVVPHGQVHCAGSSDLAWEGRKFSGNAQRRVKRFLLHHGTILYAFDLRRVTQYLPMPPSQPAYRASRSHDEFLCNLPATATELCQRLQESWQAHTPAPDVPRELVAQLVMEKYATAAWTHRR